MHASRLLAFSSQQQSSWIAGGSPKLLLPPPTWWETVSTALRAVYTMVTDAEARLTYERWVQEGIIKDHVLAAAHQGSLLTYALFGNLQNPVWRQNGWRLPSAADSGDKKKRKETTTLTRHQEFCTAVGPALQNFHDTLGNLRNQLMDHLEADKKELDEKMNQSNEELLATMLEFQSQKNSNDSNTDNSSRMAEALLGTNRWRQKAKEQPDSPEGYLSKMTTDVCLDAFYYTAKLDLLSQRDMLQRLKEIEGDKQQGEGEEEEDDSSNDFTSDSDFLLSSYVPGSCKVGETALLNARAMVIDPEELSSSIESPDSENSNEDAQRSSSSSVHVAAQMDVLYEVTHTYRQASSEGHNTSDTASSSSSSSSTSSSNKPSEEKHGKKQPKGEEKVISYTNLVVAVMEGWLQGGPENSLRWKVAMLREAFEFPHETTIIRHTLPKQTES